MVKSHLDSELPVLGIRDTIPKYIFPDVLSSPYIDATELGFSHLSFSVKGPLEFDCKVFDIVPKRDIFAEFRSPSARIGSLPFVLSIHDCKWVDIGQVSDSFDIRQYTQIKLLDKKFHIGPLLVGHIGVYLNYYFILAICCYLTNWVDTGQEFLDDSGCLPLLIDPLSSSSDAHKLFDKITKRSRCVAILYDCEYMYLIDQLRLEVDCRRIIDAVHQKSCSALEAQMMVDALGTVYLSYRGKNMCFSTLRILCHYDPLTDVTSTNDRSVGTDTLLTMVDCYGSNAIHLRLLIEETPLLIATSRKVILLISNIHHVTA